MQTPQFPILHSTKAHVAQSMQQHSELSQMIVSEAAEAKGDSIEHKIEKQVQAVLKLLVDLTVRQSDRLEEADRTSGASSFKREDDNDLAWSTSFLNAFNKICKLEKTQDSSLKGRYGDLSLFFYTINLQPIVDKVISKNIDRT